MWDNVGLAIKVALDLGIKPEIIKKTLPKIKFEGRVNYIKGKLTKNKNYKVLVDGCHSDASTKNLASHLRKIKVPFYGIWGCLKNKSPEKLIKNFKGNFKKLITIQIPDEPNSSSPYELKRIAVENGFISRIVTNYSGYGKAIYQKTISGKTIVYAHLDKFSPVMEKVVKLQQSKNKKYSISTNFSSNEFRVKKGELIGFTGETGYAFGPNLHFEVRDELDAALDPLSNGYLLPDKVTPVIKQ